MGLQELSVERYEGVADDQRILLLRGPITIETALQFERAVWHDSGSVGCPLHRFGGIGVAGEGVRIASENGTMPGADGDEAAGAQDYGNNEGERFLCDVQHDVGSGGSAG
jgi:hypothetical protein